MGCCGGTSFLQIPGNIKQNFAPFMLDPGASINQAVKSSPCVKGPPQKFTFRPSTSSSVGHLAMFPSAIANSSELFLQDLSFSSLNLNLNSILNLLPAIQIREYLPDTKLDQTINFFSDLFGKIFKGKDFKEQTKNAGEDNPDIETKSKGLRERLSNVVDTVFKTIESQAFFDTLCPMDADGNPQRGSSSTYSYIVKFPYTLYYRLQSCVTTNVYELPCLPGDNFLHSSDGKPGWAGKSGMRFMPDFVKNLPIIGKMLDGIFGNLGVNFTPWWDASAGSNTQCPEITFKFSLFNDSLDAAVVNFVFMNTIIQNSRWLQYHIFQHSPALYDVIIGGIGKYSACMGQFDVKYRGSLRQPSTALLNALKAKVGPQYNPSKIVNSSLIRIPDVYDVEMKFQSLLPQNFNTLLFNYMSSNQLQAYDGEIPLYKQSDGSVSASKAPGSRYTASSRANAYQNGALANVGDAIKLVLDKAMEAWSK